MCEDLEFLHIKTLLPFRKEFRSSDNFAVRLNYFKPFSFVSRPTKDQKKRIEKLEKKLFEELKIDKAYFQDQCDRAMHKQGNIINTLFQQGYSTTTFHMKTSWRFVPGLGTSHINETGMSLDHVCGLPFLGGSACKGVTREYMLEYFLNPDGENDLAALDKLLSEVENLQELIEKKDKGALKEKSGLSTRFMDRLMKNHDLQEILYTAAAVFGSQSCAGRVIFLDAFPESLTTTLCIMNPHHAEYYSGRRLWPDDCEKPVPIKFAAIENAQFSFGLASREKDLLDTASVWLKGALKERGAGAKASAGYGYFKGYAELIIDDLENLSPADVKSGIKDYFNNHREDLREGDRYLVDQAVLRKLAATIKNNDDIAFDRFVLDSVILKLPEEMRVCVAREMNKLERFDNEEAQRILSPLCPKLSNADDMNEILGLLTSEDTGVAVRGLSRARRFIENKQIEDNERLKVAEAVDDFDPTDKNINKKDNALKKAKRASTRYMQED